VCWLVVVTWFEVGLLAAYPITFLSAVPAELTPSFMHNDESGYSNKRTCVCSRYAVLVGFTRVMHHVSHVRATTSQVHLLFSFGTGTGTWHWDYWHGK
jgi:hypothetical protein